MTATTKEKESALVPSKFKQAGFNGYMAFKKRSYQLAPHRCLKTWFSPRTILFYPDFPFRRQYAIRHICDLLGYGLTNDPYSHIIHMAVRWQDKTHKTEHPALADIKQKCPVINGECSDISKRTVQTVFAEVFGYPLAVNPVTHQGLCVMKSDENSRHDGQLIQCPINPDELKPDCVYEKLIDIQYDASSTQEFRIPVFKDRIPFVFLKYRPLTERFRIYHKLIIANEKVSELFTADEIETILRFCRRLGLDYGELDVLRDNSDKRLYIVDVNDTPWGEPKSRTARTHWRSIKIMSETFAEVFMS